MNLFDEKTINLTLKARNKEEAIDEIINMLFADNIINDKDKYKEAILKREKDATTGIGFGIAIPHAKTDAVNKSRVAVAISRDGVDFDSADNNLANLIFMIAVPEDANDEHLRILAKLSRKLINPVFREQLITAKDKQSILQYLAQI
ncbi:PTS sugar transporter subunit IIA [Pectinatus cerevisiiphilus]|uniref:PTS system D-fructose-specific IIA component (F1P-forming) (Frc family) n=1 Tax=Pectinatus cerevisiiphilus TaxID=86956 RepID=A0A4V6NYY9_9FIRM|nr:PTS sugar transporter subunit IIA [Pectinatus cerevisiiphilus]TCS81952.1 PTS system D-fructose-specific IIA component (F1P-forming) (Frc family) [Pectinatus cerevisiiphilus]